MKVYITYFVYDPTDDEQSKPQHVFDTKEKAIEHIARNRSMNYVYMEMEVE